MIVPIDKDKRGDKYRFRYYLIIHNRTLEQCTVSIKGDKDQVLKEVKFLLIADLVGNFSTLITPMYQQLDSIELMSEKELIRDLYKRLEYLVRMKDLNGTPGRGDENDYLTIANRIKSIGERIGIAIKIFGKNEDRDIQYEQLLKSCDKIINNGYADYVDYGI
jgi:hypothetical protein